MDVAAPLLIASSLRKPTTEVETLVRFALLDANASDVIIRVKNSAKPGYHGRAYGSIPPRSPMRFVPGARFLIVLRIGPDGSFPTSNVQDRWRWTRWVAPNSPRPRDWATDWLGQVQRNRLGLITAVRWGRVMRGPYGGRRSPAFEITDWREALIALASHEMCHVEQFRYDLPNSESAAEQAAAAALARWRAEPKSARPVG